MCVSLQTTATVLYTYTHPSVHNNNLLVTCLTCFFLVVRLYVTPILFSSAVCLFGWPALVRFDIASIDHTRPAALAIRPAMHGAAGSFFFSFSFLFNYTYSFGAVVFYQAPPSSLSYTNSIIHHHSAKEGGRHTHTRTYTPIV